jgi:glycosyltransferase involved in cell wall biosynthesis
MSPIEDTLKILQLISSSGFYGAEGVVLNLSCGLRDLGCDMTLGVFNARSPENVDFVDAAQLRSLEVWNLPCKSRTDLLAVAKLAQYLRHTGTAIIHTHGYKADAYGYFASRVAPCRAVATCHNWTNRTSALLSYGRVDKLLLRQFDQVIAVSENVQSMLFQSGFTPDQIALVHNGIDTAHFRRLVGLMEPAEPFRIGALSRLSAEKGMDVLVRALPLVLRRFPQATCVIAGEGAQREQLTSLASKLGVSHALTLQGFCSGTAQFLSRCAVVAHPSRMDGMPLAILEAMSAGKAIVASNVGEIPLLLDHGKAGILVPPGSPEALAGGLVCMLENDAERKHYGDAAQMRARKLYDSAAMAREYLSLYEQCTNDVFALTAQMD